MPTRKPSEPVHAGDTRSEFGAALDQQLPLPDRRRAFRQWRHTRPFWAGVFVILAGAVIISYPLGPWPDMMAIGSAAMTGIAIGLIMILGGLFFWFAPHQRMFISIVLMICSILSLVASNLGGFFLGMILGMIGSSMAFGWKQPEDRVLRPSPLPRGEDGGGKAVALVAVGMLLASFVGVGLTSDAAAAAAPHRTQDRPEGRPPLPTVGCGITRVNAATLKAQNVTVLGTEFIKDGCGNSIEVVDLFIESADLTGYVLASPNDTFKIVTDLHIERIELPTPRLRANVDVAKLILDQLGLPSLPGLLPGAPVPIDPPLVKTLDSLGLLPLTIKGLDAAPANWIQPIIRGGDVRLINTGMRIIGPLLPVD